MSHYTHAVQVQTLELFGRTIKVGTERNSDQPIFTIDVSGPVGAFAFDAILAMVEKGGGAAVDSSTGRPLTFGEAKTAP